jgi:hypothetical protein
MLILRTKRRFSYKRSVEFQNQILRNFGKNVYRGSRIVACQQCHRLIAQIVVADANEFVFPSLPTIVILYPYTPLEVWIVGGKSLPRKDVSADLLFRYISRIKKCNCKLIPASETSEIFSDDEVDDAIRRLFPENLTIVDIDAVMLDTNFNLQAIFEFCSQNENFKVVWVTKKVADFYKVDAYLLQVDPHGRVLKKIKVDKEYIIIGGVESGEEI